MEPTIQSETSAATLESLSEDELRKRRQRITDILDARRPGTGITIQLYEFNHSYAPARQPKPYVAKLQLAADGALERVFYEIPKTGKGSQRVTLRGCYEAADLELIEDEHSQMSEGKPLIYRAVSIAYRGELCEVQLPDRELTDGDLIDYLSGNRAILIPAAEWGLERYKQLFRSDHPSTLAFEGLLRLLQG